MKKLEVERAADEKPSDEKDTKESKDDSSKVKEEKKDDKAKIKVDIGQRGGFGKFRFLKKEDSSKPREDKSKDETKEIKKEESESEDIELRKSESTKQHAQNDKEKDSVVPGKDVKKDNKITIKLSGRQFVPASVAKQAAPVKPPPPPPGKPKTPPVRAAAAFSGNIGSKGKPASKAKSKDTLDSFLSIGGQALPVIKDVEKPAGPSQDQIAAAFADSQASKKAEKAAEGKDSGEPTSEEDTQKPSFSDTLRKMLFTGSQKADDDVPGGESAEDQSILPEPKRPPGLKSPEKKETSSFSSIFNTMIAGIQPGIPGIDDGDELKPPGT